MKRVFILLSVLIAALVVRGQDSAGAQTMSRQESEENYKMLRGKVENLTETTAAQAKMIQELRAEIRDLRAQLAKPQGNYASPEDVKALAAAIKEVDGKRIADNNELKSEVKSTIEKLGKTLMANQQTIAKPASTPPKQKPDTHSNDGVTDLGPSKQTDKPTDKTTDKPQPQLPENVFEYVIKPNDTYRKIAKKYNDEGVKVTADEIAAANPKIPATNMMVGQKILIPAKAPLSAKQ